MLIFSYLLMLLIPAHPAHLLMLERTGALMRLIVCFTHARSCSLIARDRAHLPAHTCSYRF